MESPLERAIGNHVEVYVTGRTDGAWDIVLRVDGGFFDQGVALGVAAGLADQLAAAGVLEQFAALPLRQGFRVLSTDQRAASETPPSAG